MSKTYSVVKLYADLNEGEDELRKTYSVVTLYADLNEGADDLRKTYSVVTLYADLNNSIHRAVRGNADINPCSSCQRSLENHKQRRAMD